ncbi:hypothetical protein AB3X52_08125 [Nocardioides sp. DS6]|uniref:Heavy metal transporter n=1 Tax=Nocardioides eburneus TaxID=3231482 RepID=A0ABV3SXB2_9ACTN
MKKLGIAILVIAVLGAGAVIALQKATHKLDDLLPDPEVCTASVDGHSAELDPEQAENAALITGVAVKRGLPARAATIALATAMQESKLYNLTSGDRDSLGLFQQRPSQGWGTERQILDPVHATNAFYDALVRIDGYETMVITEAAQKVQRSGYPEAYAAHEPDARVLASALTGWSPHAFACRLDDPSAGAGKPRVLRKDVTGLFGALVGAVSQRGRQVTITVPSGRSQDVHGWAMTSYVAAQAQRLGVRALEYDGRRWTTGKDGGWVADDTAGPDRIVVTLS